MRIFIISMDDPLFINQMFEKILTEKSENVVGLAVAKGGRLRLSHGKSKLLYLFSLMLIMGPYAFLRNVFITINFRIRKYLSKFHLSKNPSILHFADKMGIKTFSISSANDKDFLNELRKLKPDVIINQSQSILRKEILGIPTVGIINRHNALLPKNRGRLTPFWVLFRNEKETGVSIHFVEKGIDSGPIIVQKRISVESRDNFDSLVKKNYEIAGTAMLQALDKLANNERDFLPNDNRLATYNSTPTFRQALTYRTRRLKSKFL